MRSSPQGIDPCPAGVIDWDEGSRRGLPVLYAISYLLNQHSRRNTRFSDPLWCLFIRQWPVQEELRFLDRCYAYFSASPDQHQASVMLVWLRLVRGQPDHGYASKYDFVEH